MQYENERMEYKSQLTEDIYKEVIAFTNTDGGVIYIGIDDQGNVTGIDNVDETYTRLTNGIRDAIQPDVTMFVRYVLQENKVIRIEVGEGSYKPVSYTHLHTVFLHFQTLPWNKISRRILLPSESDLLRVLSCFIYHITPARNKQG